MLKGTATACPNHPSIEATVRCKQCSKGVCDACAVPGATGVFCSEVCRDKHAIFYQRAQELDGKAQSTMMLQARKFITSLIVVAAVLFALGVVGTMFFVPILTPIVEMVRGIIGI